MKTGLAILLAVLLAAVWQPAAAAAENARSEEMHESLARIKGSLKQGQGSAPAVSALALSSEGPVETSGVKMVKGLAFCVGVFMIGIAVTQRMRSRAPRACGSGMRIIERLPLTQKTALLLIEHDGKQIMLAVGSEHVTFQPSAPSAQEGALELVCQEEQEMRLSA